MKEKTDHLSCRISEKTLEETKIQAVKEKIRLGQLVEKALRQYLDENKR